MQINAIITFVKRFFKIIWVVFVKCIVLAIATCFFIFPVFFCLSSFAFAENIVYTNRKIDVRGAFMLSYELSKDVRFEVFEIFALQFSKIVIFAGVLFLLFQFALSSLIVSLSSKLLVLILALVVGSLLFLPKYFKTISFFFRRALGSMTLSKENLKL